MRSFPVQSRSIQPIPEEPHPEPIKTLLQNSDLVWARPVRINSRENYTAEDSFNNESSSHPSNGVEEVNSNSSNQKVIENKEPNSPSLEFSNGIPSVKFSVEYTNSPVSTTISYSNTPFATFLENTMRSRDIKSQFVESSQLERWWYAPERMFCCKCQRHVGTEVKFEFKKQSFWEKVCCSNVEGREKKDEIVVHKCRYCFKVLAELFINHPEN